MRRVLVAAELRYLELSPGPGWTRFAEIALTAGALAGGGVLPTGHFELLVLSPIAAVASAILAIRFADPRDRPGRLVPARMAIVPWGVVLHLEQRPQDRPARPLRWTEVSG